MNRNWDILFCLSYYIVALPLDIYRCHCILWKGSKVMMFSLDISIHFELSTFMFKSAMLHFYLTNKETSPLLCSVEKHDGSGRAHVSKTALAWRTKGHFRHSPTTLILDNQLIVILRKTVYGIPWKKLSRDGKYQRTTQSTGSGSGEADLLILRLWRSLLYHSVRKSLLSITWSSSRPRFS